VGGPLRDLSVLLAAEMLVVSLYPDREEARRIAEEALASGCALERFRAMVDAQGGDAGVVDDYDLLPQAGRKIPLLSDADGFVTAFDTEAVGRAAMHLGAGRATKEDTLDYAAGIVLNKRVGDAVTRGEALAVLHTGERSDVAEAERLLRGAIRLGREAVAPRPLVFGRVTTDGVERF
jgi:pyrimidine-nucleoside phosphorylase